MRILVTGAGGFIGGHLARRLAADGHEVHGADVKAPEFGGPYIPGVHFMLLDLTDPGAAARAMECRPEQVYALAADMGGMGYIAAHDAKILRENLLININTIEAARAAGVERYLFSSSACVYNEDLQLLPDAPGLCEDDAYPAYPDTEYGWEKLTSERLCAAYTRDHGLATRVVRFHNVYGPLGTWRGGREKAPAAMCRKVAVAKLIGARSIDVWGDGLQTRSFMHVADCVDGLLLAMASGCDAPLNLGSEEAISINGLAEMVAEIAGYPVEVRHIDGPQGVRGRNCDGTLARRTLGWEPGVGLRAGMAETYAWVEDQVREAHARGKAVA